MAKSSSCSLPGCSRGTWKTPRPAPTGFKDWLDPKWGSKIGFIDIQYQFVMVAAALAAGGSVSKEYGPKFAAAGAITQSIDLK
mgnify:CR=1 FL=1